MEEQCPLALNADGLGDFVALARGSVAIARVQLHVDRCDSKRRIAACRLAKRTYSIR